MPGVNVRSCGAKHSHNPRVILARGNVQWRDASRVHHVDFSIHLQEPHGIIHITALGSMMKQRVHLGIHLVDVAEHRRHRGFVALREEHARAVGICEQHARLGGRHSKEVTGRGREEFPR